MKKLLALLLCLITVPLAASVGQALHRKLDPVLHRIKETYTDPNLRKIARVRKGPELPKAEHQFVATRKRTVKRALEAALGEDIAPEHLPTIAMCFSGGGYRAMIAALGTMIGADDIGLLDATTYTAALSGSTWMLAPWLVSGRSPRAYREMLMPKVELPFRKRPLNLFAISQTIGRKFVTDQPVGPVDIYGAIIANTLLSGLGKNPHDFTLSRSHAKVSSGRWPMPIYTAAWVEHPLQLLNRSKYEWMEFTPFEIGSTYKHTYIPSFGLGRIYTRGKAILPSPEPSLGYLLGIFGSAFAAQFSDIIAEVGDAIKPAQLRFVLKQAAKLPALGIDRIWPARIRDFNSKLPWVVQKTIRMAAPWLRDVMTLVDAGMIFNLPLPPLLRPERKVDIILIADNGRLDIDFTPNRAKEWLDSRGIPFPSGNYRKAMQDEITILEDTSNPSVPVIIYLPLVKNADFSKSFDPPKMFAEGGTYLSTTNFVYKPHEVRELSGLTESMVKKHKEKIYDVIRRVIARKKTPSV